MGKRLTSHNPERYNPNASLDRISKGFPNLVSQDDFVYLTKIVHGLWANGKYRLSERKFQSQLQGIYEDGVDALPRPNPPTRMYLSVRLLITDFWRFTGVKRGGTYDLNDVWSALRGANEWVGGKEMERIIESNRMKPRSFYPADEFMVESLDYLDLDFPYPI